MEEQKKKRGLIKVLMIIILSMIGTILILFIIAFTWLWIKNPLNIRAVILNYVGVKQIETPFVLPTTGDITNNQKPSSIQGFSPGIPVGDLPITDAQREAVEKAGIDVSAIQITPEMEACFISTLGEVRVGEIINGDVPGPLDIFKARSCL